MINQEGGQSGRWSIGTVVNRDDGQYYCGQSGRWSIETWSISMWSITTWSITTWSIAMWSIGTVVNINVAKRDAPQQDIYLSLSTARRWPMWRATRTRPLACVRVPSTAAACCKRAKIENTDNELYENRLFPPSWCDFLMILVPKSSGNKLGPIALLAPMSCFLKLEKNDLPQTCMAYRGKVSFSRVPSGLPQLPLLYRQYSHPH